MEKSLRCQEDILDSIMNDLLYTEIPNKGGCMDAAGLKNAGRIPGEQTLRNILGYSRALSVHRSKEIGVIKQVMN